MTFKLCLIAAELLEFLLKHATSVVQFVAGAGYQKWLKKITVFEKHDTYFNANQTFNNTQLTTTA